MIAQVKNVSGTNKLLPMAGSVPVGNPVGSLLQTYKKLQPRNYLYCDGSTFNENQYPALYLYLGTNVLPDYRECAMVGAEENTTDTIATHDVYTEGQFKDDQMQKITGESTLAYGGAFSWTEVGSLKATTEYSRVVTAGTARGASKIVLDSSKQTRTGTPDVTRGKRKAVYVYIKAVDGVDISDEDTFLDTVKNYVQESLSCDLLWENPASSTATTFSPQTLTPQTLGVDLSQYKSIKIYATLGYASSLRKYVYQEVPKDLPVYITIPIGGLFHRQVSFTDNGIEFFHGYQIGSYGASETQNDGVAVPIKIFGIK